MLNVGNRVYNGRNKWTYGTVVKKIGSTYYLVEINKRVTKKHMDQLTLRHDVANMKAETKTTHKKMLENFKYVPNNAEHF